MVAQAAFVWAPAAHHGTESVFEVRGSSEEEIWRHIQCRCCIAVGCRQLHRSVASPSHIPPCCRVWQCAAMPENCHRALPVVMLHTVRIEGLDLARVTCDHQLHQHLPQAISLSCLQPRGTVTDDLDTRLRLAVHVGGRHQHAHIISERNEMQWECELTSRSGVSSSFCRTSTVQLSCRRFFTHGISHRARWQRQHRSLAVCKLSRQVSPGALLGTPIHSAPAGHDAYTLCCVKSGVIVTHSFGQPIDAMHLDQSSHSFRPQPARLTSRMNTFVFSECDETPRICPAAAAAAAGAPCRSSDAAETRPVAAAPRSSARAMPLAGRRLGGSNAAQLQDL